MKLIWSDASWEDYLFWQQTDKRTLKKINTLIQAIKREPFNGIGKPEPLRHDLAGCWSRRITSEHRLVYEVHTDAIAIVSCRYYYD